MYFHKEQELDDVEQRLPVEHDVLMDDKRRILSAVKTIWASRVTTVLPRQGRSAMGRQVLAHFPLKDVTITHIEDLLNEDLSTLLAGGDGPKS